jgi:hypothetical protein
VRRLFELPARSIHRDDQDSFDAVLLEQVEVGLLTTGVARAVAQEHRTASGPCRLLDSAGDVGEERVAGIEHQIGEGPAAARPELARGLVADETKGLNGGQSLAAATADRTVVRGTLTLQILRRSAAFIRRATVHRATGLPSTPRRGPARPHLRI